MKNDELRDLPLAKAPDAIWASIEASLDAPVAEGARPKRVWRSAWGWGIATAAAVLVISVGGWFMTRPPKAAWDVERMNGALTEHGKIAVGEWLQTDGSSRAGKASCR